MSDGLTMMQKEDAPLVSVIIPVFNTPVEHFRRMLESVVGQAYRNLEIVVVDDGSTEENASAYEEICADDDRIVILRKENGGVSSARNLGIESAHGAYIMFMDADDALVETCIASAVRYALEYNLDIVCGGVEYWYSDAKTASMFAFDASCALYLLEGQDVVFLADYFFSRERIREKPQLEGIPRGPVAKLYKRSTVGDVRFPENLRIYEDVVFNYFVMSNANIVGLAREYWYRYYQHSYSAMNTFQVDDYLGEHAQALKTYIVDDRTARNYHAHLCFFLLDALGRETVGEGKGTVLKLRKWLKDADYHEAFEEADTSYFDFSTKRSFVYWLCRHQLTLPVYMLYARRGRERRKKGKTAS